MLPLLGNFKRSVERAAPRPRGAGLSLSVEVRLPSRRIVCLEVLEVETHVVCEFCTLEFAVFGQFARCPDCNRTNAYAVFRAAMLVCRARLGLTTRPEIASDTELVRGIRGDALNAAVAAFDALGKELRTLHVSLPAKPKNLFQNLAELDVVLKQHGSSIALLTSAVDAEQLRLGFQIRHVVVHNMGVVDEQSASTVPGIRHLIGQTYPLDQDEIEASFDALERLAASLSAIFKA